MGSSRNLSKGSKEKRSWSKFEATRCMRIHQLVAVRAQASKQLGKVGAAAMLIAASKPHRMTYTSAYGFYPRGALPVLSIAQEDALLVRRLLAKGPVTVGLDVQNSFS